MPAPSGYSFKSSLSFIEIRWRLKGLGHGDWVERDSAWYGTYIAGELWGVRMRIFDGRGGGEEGVLYDPRGFMLLDYARGETPTVEHDAKLRTLLFPALEILEWQPDERND